MVEKRSDYRKRQKKSLLSKLKSSFSDNDSEEVDVNPDFKRDGSEEEPRRRPLAGMDKNFISIINRVIRKRFAKRSL